MGDKLISITIGNKEDKVTISMAILPEENNNEPTIISAWKVEEVLEIAQDIINEASSILGKPITLTSSTIFKEGIK